MCARTLAAALSAALFVSACHAGNGDAQAPASRSTANTPGSRKASAGQLPSESDVVTVNWSIADFHERVPSKARGAQLPFSSGKCPLVDWNPSAADPAATAASSADIAEFAPPADPPPQALEALRTLDPATDHPAPVPSHDSYVADLMSLLPEQQAWVAVKPGVIDLAPGEATPDYLDDLHALAAASQSAVRPVTLSTRRPDVLAVPDETTPPSAGVYRIPQPEACETIGDKPSTNLFQPLSAIDVNTASTSPPERPNAVDYPEELKLPVDQACAYLEVSPPGYYFTATRFGVRRPSRNTFPFCHSPLYFEDPNLERCGVSWGCLTNARSVAHFAGRFAILPYLSASEPQCCRVRALADCPTCHEFDHEAQFPEFNLRGVAAEAGLITGLIFIVP